MVLFISYFNMASRVPAPSEYSINATWSWKLSFSRSFFLLLSIKDRITKAQRKKKINLWEKFSNYMEDKSGWIRRKWVRNFGERSTSLTQKVACYKWESRKYGNYTKKATSIFCGRDKSYKNGSQKQNINISHVGDYCARRKERHKKKIVGPCKPRIVSVSLIFLVTVLNRGLMVK